MLLEYLPPDSSSALWRARFPDAHMYSPVVQAIRENTFMVEVLAWRLMGHPDELTPTAPRVPGSEPDVTEPPRKKLSSAEIRARLASRRAVTAA